MGGIMRRLAALFPIVLALGAIILAPRAGAQAQAARGEGPTEIEKCRAIDKPGSYKLVNNLVAATGADCLVITADFVTIDLAGFSITSSGPRVGNFGPTAITAGADRAGIVVRNGSISGFFRGIDLEGNGSIVEGLRVGGPCPCGFGIIAKGIVRGNTAVGIAGVLGATGTGIFATGTVSGNYVTLSRFAGIEIGQGSTVIGNTATDNRAGAGPNIGILVNCPSNLTDNTAVNNNSNLVLNGEGCHDEDNVAP
jgi:hypothetical protein